MPVAQFPQLQKILTEEMKKRNNIGGGGTFEKAGTGIQGSGKNKLIGRKKVIQVPTVGHTLRSGRKKEKKR